MEGTTGVFFSTIAVINSILGVCLITLPFVIKIWGIFYGILFNLIIFILNIYSTKLLIESKNRTKLINLTAIAGEAFPKFGDKMVKVFVLIYTFGYCVALIVIVLKSLNYLCHHWLTTETIHLFIFGVFLFTIYFEELRNLSILSIFSVSACIFLLTSNCYLFWRNLEWNMQSEY